MTDVEPVVTDFAASGRAGRRNALPDILGSPAGAGTSDLPHKLAELSVSEASQKMYPLDYDCGGDGEYEEEDSTARCAKQIPPCPQKLWTAIDLGMLYHWYYHVGLEDAGAEGGEVSSSKALLESQEAEGKRNDS